MAERLTEGQTFDFAPLDPFAQSLIEAFAAWAKRHPNPDAPALIFLGGQNQVLTARQIAAEVEMGTSFGWHQIEVARHFAKAYPHIGEEGVIKMLRGRPADPAA